MKNVLSILSSILIVLLSFQSASINESDSEKVTESSEITFTLSGSVYNGHPELSWNLASGATVYELHRMPVGFGKDEIFEFNESTFSFVDEEVHGAELGNGFKQVRYRIDAYITGIDINGEPYKYLLAQGGAVDYTADLID